MVFGEFGGAWLIAEQYCESIDFFKLFLYLKSPTDTEH